MFEAHFQSFEDRGARGNSTPRLAALRAELKRRGLDGLIVPRADRYQNEYVPPCAERLAWLTGFTGSAGPLNTVAQRPAHAGVNATGVKARILIEPVFSPSSRDTFVLSDTTSNSRICARRAHAMHEIGFPEP